MPNDDRNYYVICDDNCRFPSMTKEQILSAIQQAVTTGQLEVGAGFITKIKEINHNKNIRFWIGTQAEYNALTNTENDVFYIISDDLHKEEIEEALAALTASMTNAEDTIDAVAADITQLQDDVSTISSDTETIQQSVSALSESINTIDAEATQLAADVDDFEDLADQIRSGGTVILEAVNQIFTRDTENDFTLTGNYSDYYRIVIKITVKPMSASQEDFVTSLQNYYPAQIDGLFCIQTAASATASSVSVITCKFYDGNKFKITSFFGSLEDQYFDIDIIGIN